MFDYILCREIWHCSPDCIDKQDAQIYKLHKALYLAEKKAENDRAKEDERRGKREELKQEAKRMSSF